MLDWMRRMRPDTTRLTTPPPISQKGAWFDYWDEDRSGELDKDECTMTFDIKLGHFHPGPRLYATLHAPWDVPYAVPTLIGR